MEDKLDRIGEDMKKGKPPIITHGGEVHESTEHGNGHDKGKHEKEHGHKNPPHKSWSW